MNKIKVIISGGGTGGHIFPALSIARAIEKKVSNVEFLFVGADNRMEMEKIPNEGYKIIGLWISGLQRGLSKKTFLLPFKVLYSIWRSSRIIREFKPDLAIGTGGYASGPLLYVAAKKGVPCLIQEQNSYAGVTNKILSRYVQKICVAYEKMDRFFPSEKIIFTGNPVRKDILAFQAKRKEAEELFDIDSSKPTVLVVGGSLGALKINDTIANNIQRFKDVGMNLIWQTGTAYHNKAQASVDSVKQRGINSYSFIKEMDKAYAIADVVISRAGAIAIAELSCIGKPIILVPSPNVAENHQYKNAQSLVNKNAALLVEDAQVNRKLVDTLEELMKNEDLKLTLSSNIKKIAITNAADRIAKIALDLVK